MRRVVLIGGLLTALALVSVMVTVTYTLFNIDDLIKSTTENSGRAAFNTDVTVAAVEMSLKTGDGQLIGVRIANPPGFSSAMVVTIPAVEIDVDTKHPTTDAVVLGKVHLRRPRVRLEIQSGKANLVTIRDSARALAASNSAGQGQRLIIEELLIIDGELSVTADFLGNRELNAKMPDLRLLDIGKAAGGASPADVSSAIAGLLVKATERAVRRIDLKAAGAGNGMDLQKLLTD
ncbi:MAG: hypothetical protein O2944_07120 [Proteobacteria bacterium]|nr:hypothetical protein [Pseudomonadota bacterium]